MTLTRRGALQGAIALTVPSVAALPALMAANPAKAAPVDVHTVTKLRRDLHPDALLFARCREYRAYRDYLDRPDRGDITDEEFRRSERIYYLAWRTPARTPDGLAFKMQTMMLFYEDCALPPGVLSQLAEDVQNLWRARP